MNRLKRRDKLDEFDADRNVKMVTETIKLIGSKTSVNLSPAENEVIFFKRHNKYWMRLRL